MPQTMERRKHRSDDPIIALHYQLSALRQEAGLEAFVLVDNTGVLVAGAGAWAACEELAAYSPFLVRNDTPKTEELSDRAAQIASDAHVQPIFLDGAEVLLCARGVKGKDIEPCFARAVEGCRRILAAEA